MTDEKQPPNWDDIFPEAAKQKAEQREKGLVFAQNYLLFLGPTSDPRARALLEQWTALVRRKTVAPNASAQEYAAANALREFIEAIHAQIEFAQQGLNQPKPRTIP